MGRGRYTRIHFTDGFLNSLDDAKALQQVINNGDQVSGMYWKLITILAAMRLVSEETLVIHTEIPEKYQNHISSCTKERNKFVRNYEERIVKFYSTYQPNEKVQH